MRVWHMGEGISVTVNPSERRRLKALLKNRNAPQKHVWRAQIVIQRRGSWHQRESPRVWRWQERFMKEGVDRLLRDKTRKAPGLVR
jgi:hypothetical protein